MSNHKTPLTEIEREGPIAHGLGRCIGKPSQLADVFRQGVAWALNAAPAPAWHDAPTVPGNWLLMPCVALCSITAGMHQPVDLRGYDGVQGRWYGPIPEDKP